MSENGTENKDAPRSVSECLKSVWGDKITEDSIREYASENVGAFGADMGNGLLPFLVKMESVVHDDAYTAGGGEGNTR